MTDHMNANLREVARQASDAVELVMEDSDAPWYLTLGRTVPALIASLNACAEMLDQYERLYVDHRAFHGGPFYVDGDKLRAAMGHPLATSLELSA